MIGRIAGRLEYRGDDHVMIDVGGVGYIVFCSERTLAALPGPGEAAALYTDLLVREDLLQLFGFASLIEKEWYRLLISVQGIGSKSALAILGVLGPDGVSRALSIGDWGAIKAAPGVGPKIAQRVVNELKDKAAGVMALAGTLEAPAGGAVVEAIEASPPGRREVASPAPVSGAAHQAAALSALVNLGYGQSEAASSVATVAVEMPQASEAELIREALKRLAPSD